MRRVVLVGVVLGACGREASAPPGAEGALGGVWIGSLARGDQRLPVALWLEEDGERVVGGAAQLEAAPPASTPVAAPAGLPCDELERPALGTIRERVATDLGADVVVVVSLDEDTHALIGEWAADSDAVDEAGAVRLTRVAWLPTRDDGAALVALGCVERAVPACGNGLDDDGDGRLDEEDPACAVRGVWRPQRLGNREDLDPPCADRLDNDGDAVTDADDPECTTPWTVELGDEPACADGWDEDGDGLIDLDDPGCGGDPRRFSEVAAATPGDGPGCSNGYDDDGDGFVDLDDPSCHGQPARGEDAFGTCDDGIDNDGDGATDLGEPGCTQEFPYDENGDFVGVGSDCDDGLDDDGDGATDADDPQCFWHGAGDEVVETPFPLPPRAIDGCGDGLDGDGDGRVDLNDPDCAVRDPLADGFGFEDVPPCANGADDDGDGRADLLDADCTSFLGLGESPRSTPTECADGVDDDGDGAIDADDPQCAAPYDWTEASACDDGRDDDGDGLFDDADPGCSGRDDDSEL